MASAGNTTQDGFSSDRASQTPTVPAPPPDGGRPTIRCAPSRLALGLCWSSDELPPLDYSEPEQGRCAMLPGAPDAVAGEAVGA